MVNGDTSNRLAGNLHVSIPDVPNSAVVARVRSKLAISTGSACSSGAEAPSHVLCAMKLPNEVIDGALCIGIGKFSQDKEIYEAANFLIEAYEIIRQVIHAER